MTPRALACILACASLASCIGRVQMQRGTDLPVAELYPRRADLPAVIAEDLAAGRTNRAFYVLEVHKTRRYAAARIAAETRQPTTTGPVRDLRPVFAQLFQPGEGATSERALRLTAATTTARFDAYEVERDEAFWAQLRLFERRVQGAVPYSHALRGSFAIMTIEESGLLFGPNEALLSFFVHGDRAHGFLLARGRLVVRELPTPVDALRRATRALLDELRAPPQPGRDTAWRALAQASYRQVFAPFEDELARLGIDALYVSPSDFLGNIPFSALVDGGERMLLDRMRITYLPSASVYQRLLGRPILNEPPRFLSVGNPIYPDGVEPLPFAELEAETLADVFDGSSLRTGAAATERAVSDAVGDGANILHFATHAVLLGRHVPDGSSLLLSANAGDDGFLDAAEIAALDLGGIYLAVLSACETSVTDDGASDLAGLTGAFLAAGAPSAIGSLWKVSDASTTALMLRFYEGFLEQGAGEALRRAQRATRNDPRFAHPYHWAAFELFGWDK